MLVYGERDTGLGHRYIVLYGVPVLDNWWSWYTNGYRLSVNT
jgi:hypothetical protein